MRDGICCVERIRMLIAKINVGEGFSKSAYELVPSVQVTSTASQLMKKFFLGNPYFAKSCYECRPKCRKKKKTTSHA